MSERFLAFWKKYERHINTGALIIGFSFDLYLAKRPDSLADNILLLTYLFITACCIVLLNLRQTRAKDADAQAEPLALLLILQFCYGGLANNLLILYGKSGTIGGSVLFVLLLVGLIVGNELLVNRYAVLRFNIAVYYILLLTYVVIAAPTFVFHSIGAKEFLLSGLFSLAFMFLFLGILYVAVFRGLGRERQLGEAVALVVSIFILFNGMYFTGLMPPVPLSVKDIGMYHSLSRGTDGSYTATYEAPAWFAFWRDTSATYSYQPGQSAYCFSAIFAPGGLRTPITHRWEYYDAASHSWETRRTVTFSILGGRAEGYRGFSLNSSLEPGSWRCNVETNQGHLLSRISFEVVESSSTPTLLTATL